MDTLRITTMTAIVRLHNYVNGLKFSAYEFIMASVTVAPFTAYYVVHGRVVYAVLSLGLIANFLVIVVFAIQSLMRREKSIGIVQLFNKQRRGEVHAQYPNLDTLTLILCMALIIPFLLAVTIVCEKAAAAIFKK